MLEEARKVTRSMMPFFYIHVPALINDFLWFSPLRAKVKLSKDETRGVEYYHSKK